MSRATGRSGRFDPGPSAGRTAASGAHFLRRETWNPFRSTTAVLAVLIALILLPNWRVTTMQGVMIPSDIFTSDLMNNGFPYRFYLGEALGKGEFPLWYPPVYGGFPLVARAESGVCFPLNLLLFGLLPPYAALNIVILATMIIAGAGMFLYARRISDSTTGALIAGISFAWSGFMVSHIRHLSMIGTVSLTPLGLLALEYMARPREGNSMPRGAAAGFALVLGLQILAGHIQTAYYAGLLYCAYYLVRTYPKPAGARRKPRAHNPPGRSLLAVWWRPMPALLIAGILGIGLGAVQLLPTYELVGYSQRAGGVDFSYAADYAYDPSNVLTFFLPTANGDISNGSYRGNSVFWEDYAYAGLIPLALAVVAVLLMLRRRRVRFFAAAAVAAFLIVLGPATPVFEFLFRYFPGMSYFRFPTRFLFVVDLSIAVLAAFGTRALLERVRSARRVRTAAALLVAATAADLLFFQLRQNPVVPMTDWTRPPQTASMLRADTTLYRIYSPGASEVYKQAFARARGWSGDLNPYVRQREFLQPSSNVLYGISSADGYAQLTPSYIIDIWGDQNRGGCIYRTAGLAGGRFVPTQAFMNILSISNVRYLLLPWPLAEGFAEVMDTVGGVFLYRNPGALPRAYFAGTPRVAASPAEAETLLLREEFAAGREVILYESPVLPSAGVDNDCTARITAYKSNEVVISTSCSSSRLLVLADTDYPGWRAYVDGTQTKIYRANLTQRAVVVPAGTHTVRFDFVSPTVLWGGIVTGFSLLAAVGLALVRSPRTPKPVPVAEDSREGKRV